MLTIDNKIYRNLQEQVEANKLSIQAILDEKGVLNQFGIRVIGKVDYVRELPEQDNPVHLEYGDAYAVGTETPYNLFIWTRQMSTTVGDFWFDIGKFPQPSTVPGPQGPQGQPGKDGKNSKWYISLTAPFFTAINNDMCLNVNNGDVYIYEDGWVKKGNIKGPQGIQGPKGDASTVPGPQGPQGDRGGNTTWYLLGELTSTNQLPDPTTVRRDAAYLVKVGETNHLYAIIGTDTLTWVDVGVVPQVIPSIGQPGTGTNAERFNNYTTNSASGQSSHAEGEFTAASGDFSHAEGEFTTASGASSHAEGYQNTASGDYSHAEGTSTIAGGVCSHTEGLSTKATGQYQHVQGKYNIEDTENKYAHIVGNGESSTRSNAHTVDWSGNAWYAGKVSGGTIASPAPVENDNDYVTKKYFDSRISNQNLLINPDFSINQRGQESYTGTGYGVDRWKGYQLQSMVCTPRNGFGVTLSAPTEVTGTGGIYFQPFEATQLPKLAGRTVTVSFNVSANRGTARIYLRISANKTNAGDTPNINSGFGDVVSKTITLPSPLTSLELIFRKGEGTLDVDIDWVKLEIGAEPTEFIPPLISEELPKCQRYYEKTPVKSIVKYARSTGQFYDGYIPYKVTKRVAPTVKLYSNDGTVDTLYGSTEAVNKEVTTGWQTTYGFLALSGTNSLTTGSRYEGYFTADAEIY